MNGRLAVTPNKNEFLLYSMLNALGLSIGDPDSHPLRRKTIDHFYGYVGLGLKLQDYSHHSKPVRFVLTINEAPDFSDKQDVIIDNGIQTDYDLGKIVLPHLKHFYQNTDFEDFYQEISPIYSDECNFIQGILDRANIGEILDNVWETDKPVNMNVIPMPLEGYGTGIGPSIGDTAYQIIGPPFNHNILGLVAHEGSHSRAKVVLGPLAHLITLKSHLLNKVLEKPNYPGSYDDWSVCFEEHFIRAMQAGYINPFLNIGSDIENQLAWEEKSQGMLFIKVFYSELKKYKENPTGSLTDVALRILNKL